MTKSNSEELENFIAFLRKNSEDIKMNWPNWKANAFKVVEPIKEESDMPAKTSTCIVREGGQIEIPPDICSALGLKDGDAMTFTIEGSTLILRRGLELRIKGIVTDAFFIKGADIIPPQCNKGNWHQLRFIGPESIGGTEWENTTAIWTRDIGAFDSPDLSSLMKSFGAHTIICNIATNGEWLSGGNVSRFI